LSKHLSFIALGHQNVRGILILLFFHGCFYAAMGQFVFKTLTVDEGLSSGDITGIVQDADGFIWIGTQDGLNRYDGHNIKVFRGGTGTYKLSSPEIRQLFSSDGNDLWAITAKGVDRYIPEIGNFKRYTVENNHTTFSCISENSTDEIFFGTNNGIYRYNKINDSIARTAFYINDIIDKQLVYSMEIANNDFWVATDSGLYKYDIVGNDFEHFREFAGKQIISVKYHKGLIWVGTSKSGLYTLHPPTGKITLFGKKNDFIYLHCLYPIDDKEMYVGVMDGFIRIGPDNKTYSVHRQDLQVEFSQLRTTVNTICMDKQKNLWLGHSKLGVSYSFGKSGFGYITNNSSSNYSLHNKEVTSILKDSKDRLWVGFWCGNIDLVDEKTKNIKHIATTGPNALGFSGTAFVIFEDSKGNIWHGSNLGGLQKYNENTLQFDIIAQEKANSKMAISSNDIRDIFEDGEGFLWLATSGKGVDVFDPETGLVKNYSQTAANEHKIASNFVNSIEKGPNGHIWIATYGGLSIVDGKGKVIKNMYYNENDSNSLSSNTIFDLLYGRSGKMWIGTNEGLNVYDPINGTFQVYAIQEGLPNKHINALLKDGNNYLWISTNHGLSRFDPTTGKFINFSTKDGLLGNEFLINSCTMSKKTGTLYFGSLRGINIIHPDTIKQYEAPAPVYITGISILNEPVRTGETINGRVVLEKSIHKTDLIKLKHHEQIVTLDFASLNYNSANGILYSYSLDSKKNRSDIWNPVGNRNSITFTNLPPGKNLIKIRATDSYGNWADKHATITLQVIPPYYRTWWFRISAFLLISLSVFLIIFLRFRFLQKQKNELERRVEERTSLLLQANHDLEERQKNIEMQAKELRTQAEHVMKLNKVLEDQKNELKELNNTKDKLFSIIAHDLKNPFNSILGYSEILEKKALELNHENVKQYSKYIYTSSKKIFNLVEDLLLWSRSQTNSIKYEPAPISLYEVAKEASDLFKDLAHLKQNKIQIDLEKDIWLMADKNMLNTIFINLITNSIKYTEKGKITISGQRQNTMAIISVEDTGVGIEPGHLKKLFIPDEKISKEGTEGETGTGLGLVICKEFVNRHLGDIWAESEPGKGTCFKFTIPLAQNHS
jgi:signal transduction histidine kinase/ligand-binding sensor domain-containing protein